MVGSGTEEDVIAVAVLGGAGAEPVDDFALRHLGRDGEVAVEAELGRNVGEKFVDGSDADLAQHVSTFSRRLGKITHDDHDP